MLSMGIWSTTKFKTFFSSLNKVSQYLYNRTCWNLLSSHSYKTSRTPCSNWIKHSLPHCSLNVRDCKNVPDCWIWRDGPIGWPARSPDPIACNFLCVVTYRIRFIKLKYAPWTNWATKNKGGIYTAVPRNFGKHRNESWSSPLGISKKSHVEVYYPS